MTLAAAALYAANCAVCHGPDRLGLSGPALLPENLERLKRPAAVKVIADGRMATRMQGFAGKLSPEEIRAIADWIYTSPALEPQWRMQEIRASRRSFAPARPDSDKPVFDADPLNLFIVVETGDHHATILDGDRFVPLARFPTHYALHGGPKFSPDGRYVYFGSRDGWVSKYDLWNLRMIAEVRAGINMRNIAVSSDGRWVMAANYLPHTLVALDARDLSPVKVIEVRDAKGESSRVSAVYDAAPRQGFVAALKDVKEIWEIPYGPVFGPVRTIETDDYLDDFFFDRGYHNLLGASRGAQTSEVVNLDVRRRIASIDLPGMPHLGSGITWDWNGRTVLATPNLRTGLISIIDTGTWKVMKQIKTLGPGFFLRSHENTPYAWADNFNSPYRDTMQLIDKRTLEVAKSVTPAPGKTAAHVEFTRDGRYALVSVWDMDGAIVVYDAKTLEEIKRLPMNKPSGKYNVYNKITRSDGTSH